MHGEVSKQKPKWGSVTPGGQREGEVLFVRGHWGASPQRNAAHNRRPDWPHRQQRNTPMTRSLRYITHSPLSHRCRSADGHKQTITEQLIIGWGQRHKAKSLFLGVRELCTALTAGEGFIRAVSAVSPSITVPVGGDAAAAGAAELTLGTCGWSYVEDVERREITWRIWHLKLQERISSVGV